MKKIKRMLSMLLALCMVFSLMPLNVFAVEEEIALAEEVLLGEEILQTEDVLALNEEETAEQASDDSFYRILHLDCGRKYFTKDWIIALINEMAEAGYNQLQLAFGNDGLRFLLDDMTFTANGTTYSHSTVVSKVEDGNKAQNTSGDARWLTQTEMDEIITYADSKGIEIIPLLNLPGHANAILDIADDKYNASGSNNTLNVADNEEAKNFGYAVFVKYVDYFASKGCKFFNFGADEYANDASGTFSFSRLNSTQYASFVAYINKLAAYIKEKGMTPRSFNDGLYYNGQSVNIDTSIQCCYWSSGWGSYPVAAAGTISGKGHAMINTNGDYYYVLGKDDKFDTDYSYADGFSNTAFMGSTISNPVGSMFCIWCDYPNAETETEIAQKTRLVLRAMAAKMQDTSIDTINTGVINGGFNTDGTINSDTLANKIIVTDANGNNVALTDGKLNIFNFVAAADKVSYILSSTVNSVWTSSNESVITLSANDEAAAMSAEITGTSVKAEVLGEGEATITATPVDGSAASTLNVTVTAANESGVTVDLKIGESKTIDLAEYNGESVENLITGDDAYIATAKVEVTTTEGKTNYNLVTELKAGEYYISTKANDTNPTTKITLESAGDGTYYLKNADGTYIYPNASRNLWWSYNLGTGSKTDVTVAKSENGFSFSRSVRANNNNTTTYLTLSNGSFGASRTATTLYLYTKEDVESVDKATVTFTGTGEGTTTVTIGDTTYTINVTAPDYSESKTIHFKETLSLPEGYDNSSVTIEGSVVTYSNGILTAAEEEGTAKVTFTTVNEGGKVTGHYTYNITVTEIDLSGVYPQTIEYWITNAQPVDSSNSNLYTINASDEGIYSEAGVDVATFLPVQTQKDNRNLDYWRCRLLDTTLVNTSTSGTEKQTRDDGDDETYNGIGFTKVRYYNGTWAVYTESNEWVSVESKHQLVAYYMEIVPIQNANGTTEVNVNAADWGVKGDGSSSWGYTPEPTRCSVTIQVVYEDGTTNPADTTAATLQTKTILYGYWNGGRGLGTMVFTGEDDYEISKVTAETGNMTSSVNGTYVTVTGFEWNNDEETVWQGDPTDSVSVHNAARTPDYTEPYDNLAWNTAAYNRNNAILIRVYVKAKETEESLKVVYFDEKFNDELYSYNITVPVDNDFTNSILNSNEIITLWENIIAFDGSTTRKNVKGYGIKNTLDITQWFETDLTKVPEAKGKYNSDLYTYTGSELQDDGKTLYIYYTINTEILKPNFVIDFGLPINFGLEQLVSQVDTVDEIVKCTARYGKVTYNESTKTFTYEPTGILQNVDVLSITLKMAGTTSTTNVGVTPATSVFYEENFLTYTGAWSSGGTAVNSNQDTEVMGQHTNNYGYDEVYKAMPNGGYSYKKSATVNDTASFTFTGTGFQLYANSESGSGIVTVYRAGSASKIYMIDTQLSVGDSAATDQQKGSAYYSLPIISETELAYGTYTVTITHTNSDKPVYIDGVRILGTMKDSNIYQADLEDNPDFYELRDYVLKAIGVEDGESDYGTVKDLAGQVYNYVGVNNSAVVIDKTPDTYIGNAQDLLDNGPKNELYLYAGQTLVFKVNTNRVMQLGLKAPTGSANYSIKVNNGEAQNKTLNTCVDMFYEIAGKVTTEQEYTVTITVAEGSGILSVTLLKICDDPNAAFTALTQNDIEDALMNIYGISKEEAPAEPTEPELPTEPTEPTEPEVPTEPEEPDEPDTLTTTLTVTYVNLFGRKVGSAALTKEMTDGRWIISAREIAANAPAGRRAIWLFPVVLNAGQQQSIVVPVF